MKPKPFILITVLIYLLTFGVYTAFANDIYQTSIETYSHSVCQNYVFVEDTGDQPIYSEPQIIFKNISNTYKNITYTFRMCTVENGRCASSFTKSISVPPKGAYQHTHRLNMNTRYYHAGDFNYIVTTDITGDVNEHTEKTCGIHVRKND